MTTRAPAVLKSILESTTWMISLYFWSFDWVVRIALSQGGFNCSSLPAWLGENGEFERTFEEIRRNLRENNSEGSQPGRKPHNNSRPAMCNTGVWVCWKNTQGFKTQIYSLEWLINTKVSPAWLVGKRCRGPMQFFKRKFGFVKLENKLYFISASEFGFVKQDESIFFV